MGVIASSPLLCDALPLLILFHNYRIEGVYVNREDNPWKSRGRGQKEERE